MKSNSNISPKSMSFFHKDSVIKSLKCSDVENNIDGVSLVHKDVGCLKVSGSVEGVNGVSSLNKRASGCWYCHPF